MERGGDDKTVMDFWDDGSSQTLLKHFPSERIYLDAWIGLHSVKKGRNIRN